MGALFIAPQIYVSGYGNIKELGKEINKIAQKVVVLSDENVYKLVEDGLVSLKREKIEVKKEYFRGECCHKEIDRIVKAIKEFKADAVVGFGGGKILDTIKAAAYIAGVKSITVPTMAATCAAWSSHSAVYTEDGIAYEYFSFGKNPDMLFLDKKIISEAPVRYLIAGIGDTIAKWVETEASTRLLKDKTPETELAITLAKRCYDDVMKYSEKAIISNKNKFLSKELEIVIEHIIFTAGLVGGIGGEACRSVAAHAVNNGFTVLPELYAANLHGEVVAFGNIVQLILDRKFEGKIKAMIDFYKKIGLPTTLKELGYGALTEDELIRITNRAIYKGDTIVNMPYKITFDMLKNAIEFADKLGS